MWPKGGLRRGALLGFAAMVASGGIARAQTLAPPPSIAASPAPSPSPSPSPAVVPTVAAPGASPSQTPAPPAAAAPTGSSCEAQACVTAREFERSADGHTQFRGFVDLVFGDTRIQADRLDLYETAKVDGTTARRLVAEGNVVFMKGDERLSGERMDMQLDTSKGTFDDASGYVSPGVLVEAKRIERVDAGTYKIHGGNFTSCFQPNPRWSFSASSATLHVDDKVKATNVVFRVKDVPAFYFPYFVYPIQEDQRSTGILFPRFGTSGQKGRFIGSDFFWAMGRSTDQTFTADYYSEYGWGFGHEFRYVRPQPSRGTFRTYFVRRQQAGGPSAWERDFNWNAVQMLPGKVRASIQVQESSAVNFQQIFQDSLDMASRRTTFRLLTLQRTVARQNAQLLMDSADTYYFDGVNPDPAFDRRRHTPSFTLSMSPKKIARTGIVFGYEGRAEALQIGNQDLLERYLRFDLNPRLSRPLSRSFVTLTPQVQARVTRYGSRRDLATNALVEDPLDRRYLEAGLEMRGPSFAAVFNTPGNFYSERFKHTITPEVTYTYRSKFEGFDEIPRFDYLDFLPGTNEVRYGLFQQLLAKRPGASGKPEAYEFLSLRVSQTYYVDIADAQNQFDPNYSSAFFDASGNPAHYSPLQGRLRFRPTPQVSTNLDVEYDVNVKELRNLSFSTNINYTRLGLDARYSRGRFRFLERITERDTVRGSARFQLVPNRLTVAGSVDYDLINKNMVQNTARLRYDVQCCGFMIETIESDFNLKKGREWRFNLELANIGSMGSFLGQDPRR